MEETSESPRFFSLDFHLKFFPALLRRLLQSRKYESTFAGHISLELPVLAVVSLILAIYGVAAVTGSGSVLAWVCGIVGVGGFGFLFVGSIRSGVEHRPSFDHFRVIVFLFFVFLGLTIGLFVGSVYRWPYEFRLAAGFAGLIVGYAAGIGGGLWIQYLGWMASLLEMVMLAAIAGLVIVDILLLL